MGFKADIADDRVLEVSVNIPTKAFCPPMCILFVCNESCVDTFGRIDWVGWRLDVEKMGRAGLQEYDRRSLNNGCL